MRPRVVVSVGSGSVVGRVGRADFRVTPAAKTQTRPPATSIPPTPHPQLALDETHEKRIKMMKNEQLIDQTLWVYRTSDAYTNFFLQ